MTFESPLGLDRLQGMTVAITGSSGGIGEATARALAALGAAVVLGARRRDRLERLAADIRATGGSATPVVTDVRRREDLEALVATAVAEHGRLDVMVNNAGIGPIGPMVDLRVEDWDEMIDVNLRGALYGIAAVLPHFQAQGSGHIVNVISTAGIQISPTMAVYAGTKNALRTAAEALRQENVPGLRVTSISPGFVDTDFADSMTDPAVRSQVRAAATEMGLSPQAVAQAIVYAVSQPAEVEIGELVLRPTVQG